MAFPGPLNVVQFQPLLCSDISVRWLAGGLFIELWAWILLRSRSETGRESERSSLSKGVTMSVTAAVAVKIFLIPMLARIPSHFSHPPPVLSRCMLLRLWGVPWHGARKWDRGLHSFEIFFFFFVALRQVAVLGLTLSLEGVCSARGVALGTCFPRTGQDLSWGFWLAS